MRATKVLAATMIAMGVVAFGGAKAAGQSQTRSVDAKAAMSAVIEQRMEDSGLVGVGAAIIVDKRIAWTSGYGYADKEHGVPFTPDTVMNIGSISKTFTGAALMRAVQEGKLSLDRDINAYLPFKVINPHHPDEPITLRQLATHTSGIADRPSIYEATYHFGGDTPEPLGEFLNDYLSSKGKHYSSDNFLNAKPGRQREYSNIGAALAGRIVEIAVGERLDAYTRRHFFQPLGMANSGWFLADMDPAQRSTLYVGQDGRAIPIPNYGLTTYPDGGVRTSVADLSKFFIALLNEGEYAGTRILSRDAAREMLRFQYTDANKPDNVNVQGEDSVNSGIFWATKYDGTRIGHNGSDPGVSTTMLSDPAREIGVVLFSNTSLSESGMGKLGVIFDALWAQAAALNHPTAAAAVE